MKLFSLCVVFGVYVCGGSWQLRGQTTADVSATVQATIQFSNGQTVNVTDFSNLIGTQPNDFVNITIEFPSDAIGQPVIVEAIDGGSVSTGSSIRVVEADGSLSFAFFGTTKPRLKSVGIRGGAGTFLLQFWVLDLANPQNNPSTLTAVSHG